MDSKRLSRRHFVASCAAVATGLMVAACAPKVVEVTKIVKEVVQETVIVEGTPQVVEREVTKVVKETVVMEKVVEAAPVEWPTVRWAAKPPDEGYDTFMGLLEAWETEHKIRVLYEPIPGGWDEIIQKMMAGFAAGDAPEIWRMYGPFVRKCIDFEVALNLTPFIEAENFDMSDFVPGQLLASQKQGRQYGMPDYCGIWGMYYNADILEEAGLPIPDPATWDVDQYREYTLRVTKRDSSGLLTQAGTEVNNSLEFGLSTAIWSFGGEVSDEDRVICKMSESLAMDAMRFRAAQMWEDRVIPSPAESSALNIAGGWGIFPSGRSAFHENGAWFLCQGVGNIPAIADKFRYGTLPHYKGPTGKRETFCTTDTWMASTQAEHPDACWEFEKFLVSPERQAHLATNGRLQPARKSKAHLWENAVKKVALETNPKLEELDLSAFVEGYAYARPMYWWRCNTAVMEILKPVLDQIFITNTGTVDELIPDVCKEIDGITC